MPSLTIRLGCEIAYRAHRTTPALILVRPVSQPGQFIRSETYTHDPDICHREETDSHGNRVDRVMLPAGVTTIRHDALIDVPSSAEAAFVDQQATPVDELPLSILRYTLPSRYCDSDHLMAFSSERFDACPPGAPTAAAICTWVHRNIEYRFASGGEQISASQVLARGYGVCRDFAHLVAALCRTFNIPARYATSHLPDVGFADSGLPMDFHANVEVYLDGQWLPIDARFDQPRIGRVNIAHGLDASETALSTLFGQVDLMGFQVWNYQVDPALATLNSPVDASTRLDGTPEIRITAREAKPFPGSIVYNLQNGDEQGS